MGGLLIVVLIVNVCEAVRFFRVLYFVIFLLFVVAFRSFCFLRFLFLCLDSFDVLSSILGVLLFFFIFWTSFCLFLLISQNTSH